MTGARIYWWALLLALAASAAAIGFKSAVESRNRSVAVAMSYHELQKLAQGAGSPWATTLKEFREAGLTALVIGEENLDEYLSQGRVEITDEAQAPGPSTLVVRDRNLYPGLRDWIRNHFPSELVAEVHDGDDPALALRRLTPEMRLLGIRFPEDKFQESRREGFTPVLYVRRPELRTPADTRKLVEEALRAGAGMVIFEGNRAGKLLPDTASEKELYLGVVEFRDPSEITALARGELDYRVIRVYESPPGEGPLEHVIAVRDRNVRGLFLRTGPGETTPRGELERVRAVAQAVSDAGYRTGAAAPFESLKPRPALKALIIGGITAAAALFSISLGWVPPLGSAAAAWALATLAYTAAPVPAGKAIALFGAALFPGLAVAFALRREPPEASGAAAGALRLFFTAAGISVAGGILIHGLLADTAYMLKLEQFWGVKAALVAPILLVAGLTLGRGYLKIPRGKPLTALLLVFAWVILFVLVERSGNRPDLAIPGWELHLRSWLETLLPVRPRVKEFFVGHPAFVLWGYLLGSKGWSAPVALLLLAGTIGQVSVVNSFIHLHSPFVVPLIRTLEGLVGGLVMGGVMCAAWAGYQRRRRNP